MPQMIRHLTFWPKCPYGDHVRHFRTLIVMTSRPTDHPRIRRPRSSSRVRALMRTGWLPDQHGSWMMALLPFLVGATRGGWRPLHLLVLAAWMVAFMLFSAGSWWIRSPKRQRFAAATGTWAVSTVLLGGASVLCAPKLLSWAPIFAPLIAIALVQSLRRRQRSILARLSQVFASVFMCPVAVDISIAFRRTHWFPWQGGELWPQAWCAWAALAGVLVGSVLHVRCLIRERGNPTWIVASVIWHALTVVGTAWAAAAGQLHWLVPCTFALAFTRATFMPWKHQRTTIAVKYIGLAELVVMVAVGASLMVAP